MKTLTCAFAVLVAFFLVPAASSAQTDLVTTPPRNIVIDNYNGASIGPYGGLEAGAYIARANDPSAAWFNPAGLTRAPGTQISGSAGLYQFTSVRPDVLPNAGGSLQQVPNLVGLSIKAGERWTLGLAILTTNSWMQETDSQSVITGQERFAYSADSEFSRRVAALAAGYTNGGRLRLGGGLALSFTEMRQVTAVSDRMADSATLATVLLTSRYSGSATSIRLMAGAQFDPTPHVRVGGVMRFPGFNIVKSGSITLDGTLDTGPSSAGTSVFDPKATFDMRLPFEIQGGAAYIGKRGEVEVSVLGYSSVSPYAMLSTGQPLVLYQDTVSTAPVVSTRPFPDLTSASRGLANVAVGGHWRISPDREWRLHFGVATDLSPAAPEDVVFDKVDMTGWTVGISGAFKKLLFATGFTFHGGTADNVPVRDLLNGSVIHTSIDFKTIGWIYSLSYQF